MNFKLQSSLHIPLYLFTNCLKGDHTFLKTSALPLIAYVNFSRARLSDISLIHCERTGLWMFFHTKAITRLACIKLKSMSFFLLAFTDIFSGYICNKQRNIFSGHFTDHTKNFLPEHLQLPTLPHTMKQCTNFIFTFCTIIRNVRINPM